MTCWQLLKLGCEGQSLPHVQRGDVLAPYPMPHKSDFQLFLTQHGHQHYFIFGLTCPLLLLASSCVGADTAKPAALLAKNSGEERMD